MKLWCLGKGLFPSLTIPEFMTVKFFFLDLSRGLCFSQVDNGICKGSTKMMMLVTKSDCCCSAGIAWGSQCTLCPKVNTGMKYQYFVYFLSAGL